MFLVEEDGTVNRPQQGEEFQNVTLTYFIFDVLGGIHYSGDINLKIKRLEILDDFTENIPVSVKVDELTNTDNLLKTNGLAAINSENYIELCETNSEQSGASVFTKKKVHLDKDQSFSTTFLFNESYETKPVGFGGFSYTVQTVSESVYGSQEGSLGTSGITPSISIGIESEYVRESSNYNQGFIYYSNYYLSVIKNGDYQNPLYHEPLGHLIKLGISDGILVRSDIEYNGGANTLKLRFISSKYTDSPYTIEINDIDLSSTLISEENEPLQDVYVGFTGGTGNVAETCRIEEWYFKNSLDFIEPLNNTYTDATNINLSNQHLQELSANEISVAIMGSDGQTPACGVPVNLTTSLGTIYPTSTKTDFQGKAYATLISDTEGTATVCAFAQGGAYTSSQVSVQSLDVAGLTDQSIVDWDSAWLTDGLILNGNCSFNTIIGNLQLLQAGPFGSNITWQISDNSVISSS